MKASLENQTIVYKRCGLKKSKPAHTGVGKSGRRNSNIRQQEFYAKAGGERIKRPSLRDEMIEH